MIWVVIAGVSFCIFLGVLVYFSLGDNVRPGVELTEGDLKEKEYKFLGSVFLSDDIRIGTRVMVTDWQPKINGMKREVEELKLEVEELKEYIKGLDKL